MVIVSEAEHLRCAALAARRLDGVQDFEIPSWRALMEGARPPPRDPEDDEPGSQWQGWQHEASSRIEREFRDAQLFPTINDAQRALLRSQSGPGAGMFLRTTPCNPVTRLDSFTFRILLCRRLRLPLPLTKHFCRCGPPYRFLWPPLRSLCSVRGSCSSGFCGGERGCQSVS